METKEITAGGELPPRTRRIHLAMVKRHPTGGTTSAYAENTGSGHRITDPTRNYLRVRGEYFHGVGELPPGAELPPRTRRIPTAAGAVKITIGTTSAYAENTPGVAHQWGEPGNYLRVRGEYTAGRLISDLILELPPRTRRIPTARNYRMGFVGTTSAYAENTEGAAQSDAVLGTTSAYAENTAPLVWESPLTWNYLRVRGEYADALGDEAPAKELPPRTRRIPAPVAARVPCTGTTSAYAENTFCPYHARR